MRNVPAHNQVRRLIEVIHYPEHEPRKESPEFRNAKRKLRGQGCFINNGYCEGPIEIHHAVIEWAVANEIDWEKVRRDYGFDHVDDIRNLMPLCHKHHQGIGTGIHQITYPAWILQKYMMPDALALFEEAVRHLQLEGHEEQHINHVAKKMLLHLAKGGFRSG